MNIIIKNCNNVDNAEITIKQNYLNIKYAINGTGKTTISKAISSFIKDKDKGTNELKQLKPFKHTNRDDNDPAILGIDQINVIKVFDEAYINEFVFLPDELLKGSFDIFIGGDDYAKGMEKIDDLIATLRKALADDDEIDALIKDFRDLSGSFGKPTKSGIHGSSLLSKAFKSGNKILHIPEGLDKYAAYLQNDNNYKWIKWQIEGKAYLDITDDCPYCTNAIADKKSTIRRVSEEYDSKSIENLNMLVGVFQRLNQYFSESTKLSIDRFIKNIDGYTDDQVNYLKEVKDQIDRLNEKFIKVQNLGFSSLKDVDKLIEELKSYCIDLSLFNHLQSENTQKKVNIVNDSVQILLQKAGELQGNIHKQKRLIEKLINENNSEINGFLKNAGYQYHVNIVEDINSKHKLKLIHNDNQNNDEISNVKTHLSFGERNAFSLILFMYDALKNTPDLIVLDDPISSFDKNKKYAIVDMLFRKEKCFKGKTVLLLTHDFEPIVDMVYHHTDKFAPPHAVFLENVHGELSEKTISKFDIKNFIDINTENIDSESNAINKLVYLRRLYEVTNNKKFGYQLISNLFHKREIPTIRDNDLQDNRDAKRPMTMDEIDMGISEIRCKVSGFEYQEYLTIVRDDSLMKSIYLSTSNNYEKLHIYRVIFDDKQEKVDSDIIQKFINEAFHIENDYIYQLNPRAYQLVPQYVIDECDKYIEAL